FAQTPRTPRSRLGPDRGREALSLLWPTAGLYRRANGRATGPGAGPLLRLTHAQEDLRLPALRPEHGPRRATYPDGRAGAGRADRQGVVRVGPVGARHHRQVRRPHPPASPGRPAGPLGRSPRRGHAGGLAGSGGGPARPVAPAPAPAAVA